MIGTVGSLLLGFSAYTVSWSPLPQMSGHSMSDMVVIHPILLGSVWMAGTGVKACDPSCIRRSANLPDLKVEDAGQVVMGLWPWGLLIHSRSDWVACWLLKVG